MNGRRRNSVEEIVQPGDYYGPTSVAVRVDPETQEPVEWRPMVWFLLPIADPADPMRRDSSSREAWAATRANGLHQVSEPPWVFRECPDGSLEIRESIACGRGDPEGEYFHGYLDEGNVWRQV